MPSANRVASNTLILYARMAITIFISLYATRLILAALGAADYGIFSVVGGAIAMLTFLNTAMTTASQRFMSFAQGEGNFEKQKSIFNVSVVLHFGIGLVIVILLEIAGLFLFSGFLNIEPNRIYAAKMVYHFMMLSTFFNIISVPYDAVINAHENMLFVAIAGIIEAIMKLGIAIFITYVLPWDQLIIYGLLMASMYIILLIIRRVYCHKKYEEVTISINKYFNRSLFKEMTGFASWSFLGSAVSMVTNYGQGIILNIFFGTTINAAQGVSNQISGQLGAFSGNMLKALNPVIVKSEGAGQRDKMLKASFTGSKIAFFLLALFAVPIIIEMPTIFNFWLKQVPKFAIIFCRLLLIRNLITQLFSPLTTAIAATGRIKYYQIGDSIITFLPLPVSFLLFKLGYSPSTLYIIFILMVIVRAFGITLNQAKIQCGLSIKQFYKEVILKCIGVLIISFGVGIIPFYFMNAGLFRVLIVILLFSSTNLFLIYTRGLDKSEKKQVQALISSIHQRIVKRGIA